MPPLSSRGVWLETMVGCKTSRKKDHGNVILFKRVSVDFKTQEGTSNETVWNIGSMVEHANWTPKDKECGAGKFHACSRPFFCNEFRSAVGDRYIAIKVNIKDLHAWTSKDAQYPHKIAFRKGKILYECDKFGKKKYTCKYPGEPSNEFCLRWHSL